MQLLPSCQAALGLYALTPECSITEIQGGCDW